MKPASAASAFSVDAARAAPARASRDDAPAEPLVRRRWLAPAALAGIVALAVASQVFFGAFGDISWLLTLGEAWLEGKVPYVDFIETNPPASLLIYLPAVAAARALGVRPEAAIVAQGLASAIAMLGLGAAILARAGARARLGPVAAGVALTALTILPGRTFDERDFYAGLLALPWLAVAVARAGRQRVDGAAAVVAGVATGAMIAIKPPYALILVALAPYLIPRAGWRPFAVDAKAAATLLIAYAGYALLRCPAYFHDVLPTVAAAYLPVRETVARLVANAGLILTGALLALAPVLAGRGAAEPLVAVPALAALGATAAYFVQGKGWLYHLYPALAFATLAVAAALAARPREARATAAAAGIAGATYAGAILGLPAIPLAIGATLATRYGARGFGEGDVTGRLAVLACGAMIGAACGTFAAPFPAPTAEFLNAVQSLGPHPRLAAISEGLGAGFPLTRNVGGVWVQRTQGMLMTTGARHLIATHPDDAALAARLAPIIARDRDSVAADIARNRPDGILVGRVGSSFQRWALADPVLRAALSEYRLIATNAGADWPYELYARADRLGLRPSLGEGGY